MLLRVTLFAIFMSLSLVPVSAGPVDLEAPKGDSVADRDMDGWLGEADLIYDRAFWYASTHGGRPLLDSGTRLTKMRWSLAHPPRAAREVEPQWRSLGPLNGAGRATAISPHPAIEGTFLVGAAGGGVWRTEDWGSTWTPLTDMLPDLSVGAVAYAPSNPSIIYLGSGEGGYAIDFIPGIGLIKSVDGGLSWILPDNVVAEMFYDLSVDPDNENIVVAGTSQGLLYTMDGGDTWITTLPDVDGTDLVRSPQDPSLLYASTWCVRSCGDENFHRIWRSTDGGMTWTPSDSGIPSVDPSNGFYERTSLAMAPSNPSILYAAYSSLNALGTMTSRIYRTADGGQSWTELEDVSNNGSLYGYYIRNFLGSQGWYDNTIIVSPDDPDTINAGGVFYIRSVDGGISWTTASFNAFPHVDAHDYAYQAGVLILACDGGIYLSMDDGNTWTGKNNGLVTRQYYAMDHDPSHPSRVIGGTQDNGTGRRRNDDSGLWDDVIGGDGFECAIHPDIPDIAYGTVQYGAIYRSNQFGGGASFSEITPPYTPGDGASFLSVVTLHPSSPEMVFTGSDFAWRSRDGGETWLQLPHDRVQGENWNGSDVLSVALTGADPLSILVVKGAEVFWSRDGGIQWTAYSPDDGTLPAYGSLRNAVISPHDAMAAAICYAWSDNGNLYMTHNGGASWERRDAGLPPYSVQVVRFDPLDPAILYAGTDLGFYRSVDGGATWQEYGAGLPRTSIHDIRVFPDGSMLRVATHGRGIWELPLPVSPNQPPVVQIAASDTVLVVDRGTTITFDGTTSDPDGDTLDTFWTFSDTWERIVAAAGPSSVSHTFQRPGAFSIGLTARDERGALRSATVRIEVVPEGDTCDAAVEIPSRAPLPYTVVTSNEAANFEIETPAASCIPSNAGYFGSLWFHYIPEESATYSFDTCGSGGDTVLSVWTGPACGPWSPVPNGCNDDDEVVHCSGPRTNSYVEVQLEAGVTYSVFVASYYDDNRGTVRFTVNCTDCTSMPLSSRVTIPASASASGANGTSWMTELTAVNPTGVDSGATIVFRERGKNGSFVDSISLDLPAHSTVRVDDAVQDLFQKTNSAGSLHVVLPAEAILSSRTFNNSSDGTYGQTIPAFPDAEGFTYFDDIILPSFTVGEQFRTNLGLVNLYSNPVIVDVDIRDSQGSTIANPSLEVPAFSSIQASGLAGSTDGGYAVLSLYDLEASILPYLSVVDNESGDPIFVYPIEPSSGRITVPAAAHSPGARDTIWRTDLDVLNPTSGTVTYNLSYLAQGRDNGVRPGYSFSLDPGQSRRHLDVVESVFGTEGAGAIQVTPSGGSVVVVSRTFTEEDTGTYGQFIPGFQDSSALHAGETAILPGLKASNRYRTNIGFASGVAGSVSVEYTIYGPDGTVLLEGSEALLSYGAIQIGDILSGIADQELDAWAEVRTSTPGAILFPYASVVDNDSGDPVFIPGDIR